MGWRPGCEVDYCCFLFRYPFFHPLCFSLSLSLSLLLSAVHLEIKPTSATSLPMREKAQTLPANEFSRILSPVRGKALCCGSGVLCLWCVVCIMCCVVCGVLPPTYWIGGSASSFTAHCAPSVAATRVSEPTSSLTPSLSAISLRLQKK